MQGSTFQNETMMRNHQMKRANYAMMQQSGNIVRSPSNSSLASSQSDSAKRPRKLSAVQTSNVAFNRMGGPQVLQPGVSPNRPAFQPPGNDAFRGNADETADDFPAENGAHPAIAADPTTYGWREK